MRAWWWILGLAACGRGSGDPVTTDQDLFPDADSPPARDPIPPAPFPASFEVGPRQTAIAVRRDPHGLPERVEVEVDVASPLGLVTAQIVGVSVGHDEEETLEPGPVLVEQAEDRSVRLVLDPATVDFDGPQPVRLEVDLTVEATGNRISRTTVVWEVVALPQLTALMWHDGAGYLVLPQALAPAEDFAAWGDATYQASATATPGLWSLTPGEPPVASAPSTLSYTTSDDPEAAAFTTFAPAPDRDGARLLDAAGTFGAVGQIAVVEAADWDGDGVIDGEDLVWWVHNPTPIPFPMPEGRGRLMVPPTTEAIEGLWSEMWDTTDARFFDPEEVAWLRGEVRIDRTSPFDHFAGSLLPGASVVDEGEGRFRVDLDLSEFDFRHTNPSSVGVTVLVELLDGWRYETAFLLTLGVFPEVTAVMTLDGTTYLAAPPALAPRPACLYFLQQDQPFWADEEIDAGLWRLRRSSGPPGPVPGDLRLVYFSAGSGRFVTSFNEALGSQFSPRSSAEPHILVGRAMISGQPEVHFIEPADHDGDGVIDPMDLKHYLEGQ